MHKLKQKLAKRGKKFWTIVCCCAMVLLLGASGLTAGLLLREPQENSDSVLQTDKTSYDLVQEICPEWESGIKLNAANYQDLLCKITGQTNASYDDVKNIVQTNARTAADIRKGNNNKDVELVFGGLQWEVVYLSKDVYNDPILTLWLDNNMQTAFSKRSQNEGEYYGVFPAAGYALYSDWSADWENDSFNVAYPSNMYGASYISIVTLGSETNRFYADKKNAGGQITTYDGLPYHVFMQFARLNILGSLIVPPIGVDWQKTQTSKSFNGTQEKNGTAYDLPNEAWDSAGSYTWFDKYTIGHQRYISWRDCLLWLPSLAETGYGSSSSSQGIWKLSRDQMANHIVASFNNAKVGSENELNNTMVYKHTWLRSGSATTAAKAYALTADGGGYEELPVSSSCAVRPALHLDLSKLNALAQKWESQREDYSDTGEGSEASPYIISTAEQLAMVAYNVNHGTDASAYFKLGANIFLGGKTWTPIGTSSYPFSGNFDGAGFKIYRTSKSNGVFGYISSGGVVKNLILDQLSLSGSATGGAVAAYLQGGTISNVVTYGNVSATTYAGGIVGNMSSGTIENCISNCVVSGTSPGGLVGTLSGGTIKNCQFGGTIGSSGGAGLVGTQSGGEILYCSVVASADYDNFNPFVGVEYDNCTACYAIINNQKFISTATSDTRWTDGWAVVLEISALPIQRTLYWIADVVPSDLTSIQTALTGFKLDSLALNL